MPGRASLGAAVPLAAIPLSALEGPDGVCHSHHGGHAVDREEVERNLSSHGTAWCERLAERVYEISVDSFLRSTEVQRLFVKELVQGTLAEAAQSSLRSCGVCHLIEQSCSPLCMRAVKR